MLSRNSWRAILKFPSLYNWPAKMTLRAVKAAISRFPMLGASVKIFSVSESVRSEERRVGKEC